jgi:hypothetical protein
VQQLIHKALVAQGSRQYGKARRLFKQVLELAPQEPGALYGLALMEQRHDNFARSLELLDDAIGLIPDQAVFHSCRATALLALGRFAESLQSAQEAIRLDDTLAEPHMFAAMAMERSNRLEEAQQGIDRALAISPDDPGVLRIQGRILRRRGQLDAAEGCLRSAILRGTAMPQIASQLHKELAFVLDEAGDFDGAFEEMIRGGNEKHQSAMSNVRPGSYRAQLDAYRTGIDEAQCAKWKSQTFTEGRAPVFLVGFPRSGTTMTEQILAAHPEVVTSDESMILHELEVEAGRLCRGGDVGKNLQLLDRDRIDQLRALYWRVAAERMETDLDGVLFVDKLPLNLIRLGLANAVFPEARVIVALRDPRDVCLSCLMQDFRLNDAMVEFLTPQTTAEFYSQVMGFWTWFRKLTTLDYIEVRYEDTVQDLEGQARRIIDHLGIEWYDGVLAFHEVARQREISTPSAVAVVEPVHTRAIGRWRNYAHNLEPIAGELKPFVEAFGYD